MADQQSSHDALSHPEQVFLAVARQVCADGVIGADEFEILRALAPLLGLSVERANALGNQAIREFRSETLRESVLASPEDLYRSVLTTFGADGNIDAPEEALLARLRKLLGLTSFESALLPDKKPATQAEPLPVTAMPSVPGPRPVGDNLETAEPMPSDGRCRIRPLLCPSCKAVVPLRQVTETTCAYCRTPVRIPTSYLEALASQAALEKRRQGVQELFALLGTRPSTFGWLLTQVPERIMTGVVVLLLLIGPAAMGPDSGFFAFLNWYVARSRGENLIDLLTHAESILLAFVPFALFLSVTFVLLYRLRRNLFTMNTLRVALVVGAPTRPGGPSTCRQCGSPLAVPDNAVGITCPYCSADNLVNVPADWLAVTHRQARLAGMDFQKALDLYRRESLKGWESCIAVILGALAMAFIHVEAARYLRETPEMPPLRSAIARRTGLVAGFGTPPGPALPFDTWTELAATNTRLVTCFVPLARGERLQIRWRPAPHSPKPIFTNDRDRMPIAIFQERNFRRGGKPERQVEKQLGSVERFEFSAPLGAWYRLDLSLPEKGRVEFHPSVPVKSP
ncbi:MAG TPA: hypothetical protein PLU72_05670 [Candidatus Ozemobacteraceae bacterium]|nr:hypothetical protein [Candidatus Ozemobacteraceae bacterium]HQG27225.1 hypothetical protein [Candidatus Ozemobacteraceae bacterium]